MGSDYSTVLVPLDYIISSYLYKPAYCLEAVVTHIDWITVRVIRVIVSLYVSDLPNVTISNTGTVDTQRLDTWQYSRYGRLNPTPNGSIYGSFELIVVRFPEIAQASSSLLGCCNYCTTRRYNHQLPPVSHVLS